ncbi:MAG: YaiO family outer membrane beta-barrel protein [Steroidobacteraceae bacterium]|nr:YaiO family outer membrane beta-barrel protein [Steroidobacteraceae bacterium]
MNRLAALAAAIALLAARPASACDAALEARVAADPANTDLRHELARSCARAGRADAALAQYAALLAVKGDNPDWLLGKGQSLIALGRPREALAPLEQARAVSPRYEDVWRANISALEAAGEPERAAALTAEAGRTFPEAAWPRDKAGALERARLIERSTRLSLGLSYEDLSGGRSSWHALTVGLDHPLDARRRILAGANVEERFDTRDEQFSIGLVDRLGGDWTWGVAADVAPGAEILPEWNLVAEAGRTLPGDRGISLRARHASYAAVDVKSLAATIEQYFPAFRVAYSLTASKPSGISARLGHALRLARDYGDGSQATFALGYGEEAETVAPGVVQVTRNRSLSVHGVHWATPAWGLAWEAGWHEQGDLYDRVRLRIGLEHRF